VPETNSGKAVSKVQLAVLWAIFFMFVNLSNESMIQLLTPTMEEEFGITKAQASLIVTVAAVIASVGGTVYATLTDVFSMRQLLLFGVAAFNAGTLVGFAVQDSFPALVAARVLQCAGGISVPGCFVVLVTRYLDPGERMKYLAFSSTLYFFGNGLGSFLGAAISNAANWGYALLLPTVTLLAAPSFWKHLPREKGSGAPLDLAGALLAAAGIASAILSIALRIGYGFLAAALAIAWYLARMRRKSRPFLDLSLLRRRGFRLALLCAVTILGAQACVMFLLPFIAKYVYGLGLFDTGLLLVSAYLPALAAGIALGKALNRLGRRRLFLLGWALLFASLAALALTMEAPLVLTGLVLFVFAVSNPFLYTGLIDELTAQLPPDKLGSGMGVFYLAMGGGHAAAISVASVLLTNGVFGGGSFPLGDGMQINEYSRLLFLLAAYSLIGLLLFVRVTGGKAAAESAADRGMTENHPL